MNLVIKTELIRVSPKTLFGKKIFTGLTFDECWSKVVELGWGWDIFNGKFYRVRGH